MDKIKKRWAGYFVGLLVVLAAAAWWLLRPPGLPAGFASSNGRIEATEVDIASKIAGRIDTILVKEGQFVHQGEVLARMDTRVLNEQRLEAGRANQGGGKRGPGRQSLARSATK
ncbi:membrane fusion protein family auxiliary transport protein [Klebsiella pneumoniae]|uniref:Membrane fusion protein family auxiliary transport protein n=1 Tax=Klebsiella pneumoniae TaxID=573 RepID=A0A2X3KM23_KLEPN|nr:membrane fusion protein family auxiliary transport protein [Klebsiella pneumoniae]